MAFSPRRLRSVIVIAAFIIFGLYYFTNAGTLWARGGQPLRAHSLFDKNGDRKRIHYHKLPDSFPVSSIIPLPTGSPVQIPKIQAPRPSEDAAEKSERLARLAKVKESFVHSWEGYKKYGWLRDEVTPVSKEYKDTFGGWAATLVDALDTLWILGLEDEFKLAVDASQKIDFSTSDSTQINVFETTIRYMGGFLAAYDVSEGKYKVLLDKATEVGNLLMGCFDTENRMPISRWDWQVYMGGKRQIAPMQMIVSELGSLTLEFTRLSQLTGDPRYYDAVQRISDVFEEHQDQTKLPGMWPTLVDGATPRMNLDSNFQIGGMSDSLYEYLPKQYMMLGGVRDQSKKMYEKFMAVAREHLFFKPLNPQNADLLVAGRLRSNGGSSVALTPHGEHLTCFAGGMVAMASRIFNIPSDLKIGKALTDGCIWAYDSQVTGIGPEIYTVVPCEKENDDCIWTDYRWHKSVSHPPTKIDEPDILAAYTQRVTGEIQLLGLAPGFTSYPDPKYILRPEAIESVFMLYRITGEKKYQDAAWRMFKAVEKYTRTATASSAIDDVRKANPEFTDSMESFWLAETLKYFYLCFAEWDVVDLDTFVLNTEAHPLRRPGK